MNTGAIGKFTTQEENVSNMARKQLELTILPPAAKELRQIVPGEQFEKLPFWKKLNTNDKAFIQEEGEALITAQLAHIKSGLVIGEHLVKVRDRLKPINGAFSKFTRAFGFKSERTIYRYTRAYENAVQLLPRTVIDVAAARGMRLFGDTEDRPLGTYTEAYKLLPPPKAAENDPEVAHRYLDQLEKTQKEYRQAHKGKPTKKPVQFRATPKNQELWLMTVYRTFKTLYNRLPPTSESKARKEFVSDLIGMILTEAGSSGGHFGAVAVPAEFRRPRGRPRNVSTDEAEEPVVASA